MVNYIEKMIMQHVLNAKEVESDKEIQCCGNCKYYISNNMYVGEGWCCLEETPKERISSTPKCEFFLEIE